MLIFPYLEAFSISVYINTCTPSLERISIFLKHPIFPLIVPPWFAETRKGLDYKLGDKTSTVSMTSGWLFDAYPLDNKMIFWIKQEDGNIIRLEDNNWNYSVYVASDNNDYAYILKSIQDDEKLIKEYDFALRYEGINDTKQSKILKLTLLDFTRASTLARKIETLDVKCRVYNVGIPPAQSYFYEHKTMYSCILHLQKKQRI